MHMKKTEKGTKKFTKDEKLPLIFLPMITGSISSS